MKPAPFDPQIAKDNHLIFYVLPQDLKLAYVDALLRPVVASINASGWVWTAESCQGHPDAADYGATAWGFNTGPFLRLVVHGDRLGDMLARLIEAMRLPYNAADPTFGPPDCVMPLKLHSRECGAWREVMAYVEAHNVMYRNLGIRALARFAETLND